MASTFIAATSIIGLGPTAGINSTGANLLLAAVTFDDHPFDDPIFNDSKGNTWTWLTFGESSTTSTIHLAYSQPTSVGASHTLTVDSLGSAPTVAFAAFGGLLPGAILDQTNDAGTPVATNPLATGNITPTVSNSLVVTVCGVTASGGTISSVNQSFTIATTTNANGSSGGISLAYRVMPVSAAVGPSWSFSGSSDAQTIIYSFKGTGNAGFFPFFRVFQ